MAVLADLNGHHWRKLIGNIPLVNVGKFSGQLAITGTLTSVAVQSSVGGLAVGPVKQK
jgi:hypothetical protein